MPALPRPIEDRSPWYRQPWPWLLMSGPLAVILAGAVTAWLAVRSYDGLIADDYYKQGLAVNQVLGRAREAELRGIAGTLQSRPDASGMVELRLRAASGAMPQSVRILLNHPTRAGMDRTAVLVRVQGHELYSGRMPALAAGRWNVIVEDDARQWRIRGHLAYPGAEAVALRPAT